MQWSEKYRPRKLEEFKSHKDAVEKISLFVRKFPQKKKAVILHGPPGTGKTTLAHVLAKEYDSEIFELNASDLRNKDKLQEILKPAMEQRSLNNKSKIILIDEVDGVSGYEDRGGITELIGLIAKAKYPIIMTANDVWSKKLAPVRKVSDVIELKEVDYKTVRDVLIGILRRENKFISSEILTKIAVKAKGDFRAAINDLQTISKLPETEQAKINFDERNKEISIFDALKFIFKNKPTDDTLRIFDSVNMPLDEIILWLEENISKEYKNIELAKAYALLGKTDVFKGRIYKQQYWRFMVYENIFSSYGISASKDLDNPGNKDSFTSYKKPTRILKIWMNNQRTIQKKSISEKYSRYTHIAIKRAMHEFPIIKMVINSNPEIAKELKLSEEEIAYLKG